MARRRPHAGLQAAAGRALARRQAVHGQGRAMHLRPAAERRDQAAPQSQVLLVRQRRDGEGEWRFRRHFPSQGTAALAVGNSRLGLFADLSLPHPGGGDAPQAGRHGAVQARRVQDEREHQALEKHRLLEEGVAVSRRHRIRDHARPFDPHAVVRERPVRYDVPVGRLGASAQEHSPRRPERPVHDARHRRRHQSHRQSRDAAVQRRANPSRAGACPGPQGVHRHPRRGRGQHERRDAAAARRRLGHAAGNAEEDRGLWRCGPRATRDGR